MPVLEGIIEPTDGEAVLVPATRADAKRYFVEEGALRPVLEEIARRVREIPADVSTPAGRAAVASLAYRVARTKTAIDGMGKDIVDELKDLPRKVDAARKDARDFLDALKAEVRGPLEAYEAAETALLARLQEIRRVPTSFLEWEAPRYDVRIAELEAAMTEDWGARAEEAAKAAFDAVETLLALKAMREKHDADQAELARLRAEAEARAEAERQDALRREGEERARREAQEAEARALEAQAEAERRAQEAEERAARAEEEARLAAERREAAAKAEAEAERLRREADVEHRRKVNGEVAADLQALGLTEAQAKSVITAIVRGAVRHAAITY